MCAPDDGWRYHPKHVEQFPDKINCVTLHLVGYILEYNGISEHDAQPITVHNINDLQSVDNSYKKNKPNSNGRIQLQLKF